MSRVRRCKPRDRRDPITGLLEGTVPLMLVRGLGRADAKDIAQQQQGLMLLSCGVVHLLLIPTIPP